MANNSSSAYLKWKHKQQMPDDTHLIQCNTSIPNHTKPYKLPCILYSIQHTPYVICALYLLLESMESLSEAQRTQTLFQFAPQLTPESLVEYFTTRWRCFKWRHLVTKFATHVMYSCKFGKFGRCLHLKFNHYVELFALVVHLAIRTRQLYNLPNLATEERCMNLSQPSVTS